MPGVGISLLLITVGAILDFAITVSPLQHGFNVNTVGVILMIVGGVGLVVTLLMWGGSGLGTWRRRTMYEDDRGTITSREDVLR